MSSHFYPDFGLCQCRKHCQDFRDTEVEEPTFDMGFESSDEEIREEVIDFASDSEEDSRGERVIGGLPNMTSAQKGEGHQ